MKIVTIALPYANGPLHVGHIFEAIFADIYVRFKRDQGQKVYFVSGQDAHGAAITWSAQKQNIDEETFIANMALTHQAIYDRLGIAFDAFSSTHHPLNENVTQRVYKALKEASMVVEKSLTMPFDAQRGHFLADRFLKGSCPLCKAPEQYGDHCEKCGGTYDAQNLIDPRSRLSEASVTWKDGQHVFVRLEQARTFLLQALENLSTLPGIKNKLREWFQAPLQDWDITRDAPYFGFKIPDRIDQYFYVWMDAPCGYLTALAEALDADVEAAMDLWQKAEVTHVIGKDILYFHGLFWPSMLQALGLKPPTHLCCHGFVNLDGQKMSKSQGRTLDVVKMLDALPADVLRYYLASKMSQSLDDVDVSAQEFLDRIHGDLIGKVFNLGSRLAPFAKGHIGEVPQHAAWLSETRTLLLTAFEAYEDWNDAEVCRIVMRVADRANALIQHHQPWKLPSEEAWEHASCGLQVYRWLWMVLRSICPELASQALSLFAQPSLGHELQVITSEIGAFEVCLRRFDRAFVETLFE